jgi:sulfonate transport system substrate-binding protein
MSERHQKETDMSTLNRPKMRTHSYPRKTAAALFAAAIALCSAAAALAEDTVVLRVGDQKGGNRSLLDISGLGKDLPYKIEWSEFPAAAPILEALNAGALDVGYTATTRRSGQPPTSRASALPGHAADGDNS